MIQVVELHIVRKNRRFECAYADVLSTFCAFYSNNGTVMRFLLMNQSLTDDLSLLVTFVDDLFILEIVCMQNVCHVHFLA